MKIYVSGLYCGTSPQPGVGLARSLRSAYPNATLVGVEYSNRSSGIHWPDFDELWLQRPWDELDLDSYAERIRDVLDSGAMWVSGIDLETMWLSDVFPLGHPNLLTPPADAVRRTGKPAITACEGLPLSIPTFVWTQEHSDWELHAFCRRYDWKLWLKGPYYEAVRVRGWADFAGYRALLTRAWSTEKLFLQAHVTGYEESVMLAAYKGELLECVQMRKRELTEENKTWAGDISGVPEEITTPLRKIVRDLNWTGGAELEMLRDTGGRLWLMEWNPRFPAWVHGATIAGHNLPASLVEAASGVEALRHPAECEEFTRVVLEVPVRPQYPLPPLPEPFAGGFGHSMKHPSGTLAFAERLHKLNIGAGSGDVEDDDHGNGNGNGNGDGARRAKGRTNVPASFVRDLASFDFSKVETPSFLFLEETAREIFTRASRMAESLTTSDAKVTNAYSIKTNPDERLIRFAREHGFLAEAISLLEVRKALEVGFRPEEVILNGPGKWWPEGMMPKEPLHAVFSDSLSDLRRVADAVKKGDLSAKVVGVRLRTPTIASRFGIPVDSPEAFEKLVESVLALPRGAAFGVHFHMASSNIGVTQWWHLYESMLKWCRAVEGLTGRDIECLDVGGGWFPDDWHADSVERFADAVALARRELPHVRQVVSEPGKAVSQPSMAVAMRVLEIQEHEGGVVEAVVDGSIAELPMHAFQPHRILARGRSSGAWHPLARGKTYLMGRLCMEHDVVASGVALPEGARAGDVLVFCDAGAYDRSMSYVFGRG